MRKILFCAFVVALFVCGGCLSPNVKIFTDAKDPLLETVLAGHAEEKIAIVQLRGFISDSPGFSFLRSKPSLVQELVSQLYLAAGDPEVKAVLLKINSPGGTVTASDIVYHEIMKFKKRTGKKLCAIMMDVATSGGYMAALPADRIMAHPSSITGSVGVVFLQPKLVGLMDKIGVGFDVSKSGNAKDMGSPFRNSTEAEKKIFNKIIKDLGRKFIDTVKKHRRLSPEALREVGSARIFLADEALNLNLIDSIGYIDDAIAETRKMSNLPPDTRIVIYRRSRYPDDNIYNTSLSNHDGEIKALVDLGLISSLAEMRTGFYYMWPAAAGMK